MLDVTIIIPTIYKNNFVERCLSSIYQYVEHPIHVHLSMGYNTFSKACNEAFRKCNTEWVLFLNDDIEVKCDFISKMMKVADDFNVPIVGAKLLYPDKTIQHIGVYFRNGLPYHKDIRLPDRFVNNKYVPAVTGACMLVKSEVFERVDGFDEEYINGFEDIDLVNKIKSLGYNVALCGETEIIHYEKQSRGFNRDNFNKNIRRYQWKWVER